MDVKTNTLSGLSNELKNAVNVLSSTDHSTISVASSSELLLRFITLAAPALDVPNQDFRECKNVLLERGRAFAKRVTVSRDKIAYFSRTFIRDGSKVLTHAHSRVVFSALRKAVRDGKMVEVFVTESRPNNAGEKMCHELRELGIKCTLILDSAVSYIMDQIDYVLVGAEGVVETGGIINKIGTLNLAVSAKSMNKPFYVLVESVKFVKEYPLNQRDVPTHFKYRSSILKSGAELKDEHPLIDYTPPQYIALLFTDLGILTPAAISDELIKLYL
uniref:Translation initiation factor eIF2B subunit alpha n=1 Tax=Romanomermis culicivorax TaxID=13658 RepID=A0A915HWZ9_ROMCU